jgi:tetratricopeptide (TPR) repeat protein
LLAALELWPTHNEALESAKDLYRKAERWDRLAAILTVEEASASQPEAKVKILLEIARLQTEKLANPAGAVPALERAVQLAPRDRDVLLRLIDVYTDAGRHDAATPLLRRLLDQAGTKRSKDVAVLHHRLGRALEAGGDLVSALGEYEAALKIDITSVPVLRDLGKLAFKNGDLDKAHKTFRALQLQKLGPDAGITPAEVHLYMARILVAQGEKPKALLSVDRGLQADPRNPELQRLRQELKG